MSIFVHWCKYSLVLIQPVAWQTMNYYELYERLANFFQNVNKKLLTFSPKQILSGDYPRKFQKIGLQIISGLVINLLHNSCGLKHCGLKRKTYHVKEYHSFQKIVNQKIKFAVNSRCSTIPGSHSDLIWANYSRKLGYTRVNSGIFDQNNHPPGFVRLFDPPCQSLGRSQFVSVRFQLAQRSSQRLLSVVGIVRCQ